MRRVWVTVGALFAVSVGAATACIDRGTFACELDDQCGSEGVCEPSGFCSHPDAACPSGRRYSEVSAYGAVCTNEPDNTSTGGGTDTGTGTGPVPGELCGNDQLDPGEICDDGNRQGSDGCNSYCIAPGGTVWEYVWDSEDHDEDRAFAIALSPDESTFAIAGVTAVPGEGWDILVQSYEAATGTLLWTYTYGGDAKDEDSGEEVAFDSQGNIVVTGRVANATTSGDLWLTKFDPDGNVLWTSTRDDDGGDDKGHSVAMGPADQIVVSGHVGRDQQTDIWLARFSPGGDLVNTPIIVSGDAGESDEAIDVRSDAQGNIYTTGWIFLEPGVPTIWTAAYDRDDVQLWEDVYTHPEPGDVDRGVGIAFDLQGNAVVAGTASQEIWIRRYAADGTPTETIEYAGPEDLHDEASDVVFAADGSFIVTGFTGFATIGFARSDIWVRRYDAMSEEVWTVTLDGAAMEIDKALAVAGLADGSVIAAGYVTTPGQLRDVWLRKIAP
jgi:cysteine-rich repeat protein